MSRSLDPDTASSIKSEISQQVYFDIATALSLDTSQLLEIEFLGKSHPLPSGCNVLVDGNYIAVTKSKLVQAFIVARQLFFKCHQDLPNAKQDDIRNTTAVMLLMDPENLTAANARKRLIQRYQDESPSDLERRLREEIRWVDSMLTSRLHRHTKSPTLWGHRRWVLGICQSVRMPHDVQRDLASIVMISAERHPRNYYAWQHMRWLLNIMPPSQSDYSRMLSIVLKWCMKHPGDTSGLSFLLFCLSNVPEGISRVDVRSSTCEEVLGLANSFKWTHESVWVFLRTLVACGVMEDQKIEFFKSIETMLETQSDGSRPQLVLYAARNWCTD